jgi:hypothetical protein
MQLSFALYSPMPSSSKSIMPDTCWQDVSAIAKGLGFTTSVQISHALHDAIAAHPSEDQQEYDQRLYDALWLAHHYLSLDQCEDCTFTFHFTQREEPLHLRLRVELQGQIVSLGLPRDFQEASHADLFG